jgi:hypothetical protein
VAALRRSGNGTQPQLTWLDAANNNITNASSTGQVGSNHFNIITSSGE